MICSLLFGCCCDLVWVFIENQLPNEIDAAHDNLSSYHVTLLLPEACNVSCPVIDTCPFIV